MSKIFGLLLALAVSQVAVDAQALHMKLSNQPPGPIKTTFKFSGELICRTVRPGSEYAFWVELWEADGFFGTRVGDDHLQQAWRVNDTVYPHTYWVLGEDDGDGWDPSKKYEPYIRVNHNCTPDRSVTITDFPVELADGRFDIMTTQYIHEQVLDLTPATRRRHRRSVDRKGDV